MSDLITRMKGVNRKCVMWPYGMIHEAADKLTELESRIEELTGALEFYACERDELYQKDGGKLARKVLGK